MKVSFKPNTLGIVTLITMIILIVYLAIKKKEKIKKVAKKAVKYIQEKTWDYHSDRRIKTLHPLVRDKVKEFIIRAEKELGIKLRITSAHRTWSEQTKLYNQGRSTKGKVVTNAKAGQSLHNYGLAFDVVEIRNGKAIWRNSNWNRIAELGKQIGFSWGGDWKSFKDKPHFEMRFNKSLAQLKQLYTSGKRNGEFVNLG